MVPEVEVAKNLWKSSFHLDLLVPDDFVIAKFRNYEKKFD